MRRPLYCSPLKFFGALMSLFSKKFTRVQNPCFRSVLYEVEAFLNEHYLYRDKQKYGGLWGKVRDFFDRSAEEEREKKESTERNIFISDTVFYSDPHAEECFKEDIFRSSLENPFSTALMQIIAERKADPVTVYKKARIDRKLFSKIKNTLDYIPGKKTVIAFALALELSLDETNALLKKAGFVLSDSILFDVIIQYFILKKSYDLNEINAVLHMYDLVVF